MDSINIMTEEGKFKTVVDKIQIPQNPPTLILIAGPCRVGTTALSNVFARAGISSYMQPIKSMRRAVENGEEVPVWNVLEENIALSKETFGPKTESEFFNPVDILLESGYPKDKIKLVGIVREPSSTLTSWTWMWDKVYFDLFIKAYQDTQNMMTSAEITGVETLYYVHEAIRDNDPALVAGKLFNSLISKNGVEFGNETVDWEKGKNFDEASEIKFFDTPPGRFIHAIKTWGGYQYRTLRPDISRVQIEKIKHGGTYEIYDYFLQRCREGLGIEIFDRDNTREEDFPAETKND